METGPGEPDDPAAGPDEPGDKTYRGSITTTWGEPNEDNPHPGRVTLSIKTPSTGKISVTDASGNVFTADFLKDADGRPVRGEDGTYTLVLDPTAVGSGKLTIRQEANGAYTGSTWVYDVTVNPDVTVAPAPSLSKKAENLTHPDGHHAARRPHPLHDHGGERHGGVTVEPAWWCAIPCPPASS